MFSRSLLVDQLGAADPSIEPDVVMLHNADVYMPYWRRTLAELLQMQSKPQCTCTCITFAHESDGERGCPHANCRRAVTGPVVLTVYCEYEVHKVDRMLNWAELEFTDGAFAECDNILAKSFGRHVGHHAAAGAGTVPEPRTLWDFEPNPHAHKPPRNCYSDDIMKGEVHGVRNAYWRAFTGEPAPSDHAGRSEL